MRGFFRALAHLIVVIVLTIACKPNKNETFDSPPSLFAELIHSHTRGLISTGDALRIQFAQAVTEAKTGQAVSLEHFKLNPKVAGSLVWIDDFTLEFKPDEPLKYAQKYEAVLDMQAFFPVLENDLKTYRFSFETRSQSFEYQAMGVQYLNKKETQSPQFLIDFTFADRLNESALNQLVSATQNNQSLTLKWLKRSDKNAYRLQIIGAKRAQNNQTIVLRFKPEAIGSQLKMPDSELLVPAMGQLQVLGHFAQTQGERYVSVFFSDPINNKQNLEGLVQLPPFVSNQPRCVVMGCELRVYIPAEAHGTAKLIVQPGIESLNKLKLKELYTQDLDFSAGKPMVRFTGDTERSLLPSTHGMKLPFEAIGLKSVEVEVVEIFENNLVQHLQVNDFNGQYQLKRVGRPIARRTFDLQKAGASNLHKWNGFSLDLEELFQLKPGRLYQIKLSFGQRNSAFPCLDQSEFDEDETLEQSLDEWSSPDENSEWDYWEDGYYPDDYNWQERENPCSSSYYSADKYAKRMVMATDLGLIAKRDESGNFWVFANDLVSTKPIAGASISLIDFQQQILAEAKTDNDGAAKFKIAHKPFVVMAKWKDRASFLKVDDASSLSLSHFDLSGQALSSGMKGFMYGERGVWRPGDTIHMAFMLEPGERQIPGEHPVLLELRDPQGQVVFKKRTAWRNLPILRFDIPTKSEAITGVYNAKISVGGARFEKPIRLEAIKPNRLKMLLTLNQEVVYANQKSLSGQLEARWLTGAEANGLKAVYEMDLNPTTTKFKGFEPYLFDDASRDFESEKQTIWESRIGKGGKADFKASMPDVSDAPGALRARLYGRVFEPGGDFSISQTEITYYPFQHFVGLLMPKGDKRGMLLTDQDHEIELVRLNAQGKPMSSGQLTVELYKLDWRWWWDRSAGDEGIHLSSNYSQLMWSEEVEVNKSGKATARLKVNYPEWGRFYVRVVDNESGHSTGNVVYFDWPGWAGKARGELAGLNTLDFGFDKESYQTNETMQLSVPTTPNNRILVSLESGSRLLKSFWVESQGDLTKIPIKIEPEMAPNVYVHLSLIQPHAQTENDLPMRLYGVQSVKVVDPLTEIKPKIKLPAELKPQTPFELLVSETNGKPMTYTIAIVDEGLLDITGFKTPDPHAYFYAREALGVRTWDLYNEVINANAGALNSLLAVGGDGSLKPREDNSANRFKPVVKFLGPFNLEAGKSNKHKLVLPPYVGSVRTMVVGRSGRAYGSTETSTPVRQPLMVLASLPRIAGPGEEMALPVNVFALQNQLGKVQIKIKTDGALKVKGQDIQELQMPKKGDRLVYFQLMATSSEGVGKVKIEATAGKQRATWEVEIQIANRNPFSHSTVSHLLESGQKWSVEYKPYGLPGSHQAVLELSSLPLLNLEQRLEYLMNYPHGCLEQTTSAAFAQLHLPSLVDLSDEQLTRNRENIKAGIERLSLFRTPSGDFSYWPGANQSSPWASLYAGHFLTEAKTLGYEVNSEMLDQWTNLQTQLANTWNPNLGAENSELVQSYRLYVLALGGQAAIGPMNRLRENPDLGTTALYQLAAAYALAKLPAESENLLKRVGLSTKNQQAYWEYTYGSTIRDEAIELHAYLIMNKQEKAFEILQNIAGQLSEIENWYSTQSTAFALLAVSHYAEQFKINKPWQLELSDGGQVIKTNGKKPSMLLPLANPGKARNLMFANTGKNPVYIRLTRSGKPEAGAETSESRGLSLSVTYKNSKGEAIDVGEMQQGTDFTAQLSIQNTGTIELKNVALTQIFASGWELRNARLEGVVTSNQSNIDYFDQRDDRILRYFTLQPGQKLTFEQALNAAYIGRFYLPQIEAGPMYNAKIYARLKGQWVNVIPIK